MHLKICQNIYRFPYIKRCGSVEYYVSYRLFDGKMIADKLEPDSCMVLSNGLALKCGRKVASRQLKFSSLSYGYM